MVARAYNAPMRPARAGRTIAALGLLWALAAPGRAADPPALPSVPRFAVAPVAHRPARRRPAAAVRRCRGPPLGLAGRRDRGGGAVGPPAEARERLPPRLPRARVRGAHPRRRRRAHDRGAAGGHDDHVQPRHFHRPPARPRPARRAGAAGASGGGHATGPWRSSRASARCCSTPGPAASAGSTRSGARTIGPSSSPRASAGATRSSARRGRRPPRATRPTRCRTRRAPSRSRSTPRGPRARWCRSRSSPAPGRGRRSRRPTPGCSRAPRSSTRPAAATPRPCARTGCGSTRPRTASTSRSSGRR